MTVRKDAKTDSTRFDASTDASSESLKTLVLSHTSLLSNLAKLQEAERNEQTKMREEMEDLMALMRDLIDGQDAREQQTRIKIAALTRVEERLTATADRYALLHSNMSKLIDEMR